MDCAKFETTMIDELYGELDELTSAAANRHATGCARCSALIGGLRATRRVATLPLVEPPADLEDRILAATKNAAPASSRVVAMSERRPHALAFITRPQVAMAALFLLMVGASAVLLRKGEDEKQERTSSVAASAAAPQSEIANYDGKDKEEDRAEGEKSKSNAIDDLSAARATKSPEPEAPAASGTLALATAPLEREAAHAAQRPTTLLPPKAANVRRSDLLDEDKKYVAKQESASEEARKEKDQSPGRVAQGPAPMPAPPSMPQTRSNAAGDDPFHSVGGNGQNQSQGFGNGIAPARTAFESGRYSDAFRIADNLAANDPNAALIAARSLERMGGGCAAAVQRYDEIARRAQGTSAGYEATLEAGRCYRALGNTVAARDRLNRLLPNAAYAPRARQILETVAVPVAAAPAKATATATATSAPPAASPPPAATAAPADQQQQQQQQRR